MGPLRKRPEQKGYVLKDQSLASVIRGNVLWLSIVSLLTDLSSEMIYPLLPLFLLQTLGAGPALLGVIEGVAETTSSMLKLASGWLSDRFGRRKPLVLGGYALASFARPLMALARAPWHVLVIRFTDRIGKGLRTAPRDVLLADAVPPEQRGRAFGVHRAADHAGAVMGPLVASAVLLMAPGQYRLVFALAFVPALASVAIIAAKVREPAAARAPAAAQPHFEGFGGLSASLRYFLLVVTLFTLGNATDAFLLVRAQQLGVPTAFIPLLWSLLHLSKVLASLGGGTLADRWGERRTILSGWTIYVLVYIGFAFVSSAWQVWLLFFVYGWFYGLTEAPEKALIARLAHPHARGAAFGAYHFAIGIAALPASVIFGLLWQHFGAQAALLTGAALGALAALLLAARKIEESRSS